MKEWENLICGLLFVHNLSDVISVWIEDAGADGDLTCSSICLSVSTVAVVYGHDDRILPFLLYHSGEFCGLFLWVFL